MAVNDFCRLCEVNLRIHGTTSASKLIFDSRDKQENICSQLSKLGLISSVKHCSCCNLIARLQHEMAILKDWKISETLTCFSLTIGNG